MADKRKNYLITTKEGVSAAEIAEEQVSSVLGGANVLDAVSTMAGEEIPSEDTVLTNEDFGIVTASLTEKEAKDLARKKGIEYVEEDEEVFATHIDDDQRYNFVDEDPDASAEIEQSEFETALDLSDEEAAELAKEATEIAREIADDVEFDEAGNAFALDASNDPQVSNAFASAGVPKDKIAALIRCIIRCVIKELSEGKATDITEEQIESILTEQGLTGSQASVQAIRDYITCGLKLIYAQYAWRYSTGWGVRVAVIDTGIAPRHPDLTVYGGVSTVPGVGSWHDDHGHGTHVAGTIAALANNRGVVGVAPHARLYAVKVLNRAGSGSTSSVINGLAWCYRYNMHVANLSLGSLASSHKISDYSHAFERAGRLLRRKGILAVAAAGNSGRTSRPYVNNPARCPSFMAVAAVDCKRKRASFSSYGPQVEISAPGVNVWSTYPPNRYRQLSGTSMAAPHVAGVAALVKRRHPSWHGDSIRVWTRSRAIDLGVSGRDWAFGYGLVNAYHSVL